jgi:predicted ATPase
VLSGEPGIGKTRLLTELAARADTEQLVLFGSASELERDLPYYVFVDALDEYLHAFEPSRLDALDEDVRTGLAAVFPSLHRFAADGDGFVRHERYRTHSAVRELLERLTAAKPLVLVLDDLHWADSASVDLLGALLHRPPDAAVLLSLAVRPQQIPERLSAAFLRAERAGLLVRQDLGALTREDAGELLGEAIDERTAATLYDESGGNPLYLEQLARWLVARARGTSTRDRTRNTAERPVPADLPDAWNCPVGSGPHGGGG